jgi:phage FluMu protein Com
MSNPRCKTCQHKNGDDKIVGPDCLPYSVLGEVVTYRCPRCGAKETAKNPEADTTQTKAARRKQAAAENAKKTAAES